MALNTRPRLNEITSAVEEQLSGQNERETVIKVITGPFLVTYFFHQASQSLPACGPRMAGT